MVPIKKASISISKNSSVAVRTNQKVDANFYNDDFASHMIIYIHTYSMYVHEYIMYNTYIGSAEELHILKHVRATLRRRYERDTRPNAEFAPTGR